MAKRRPRSAPASTTAESADGVEPSAEPAKASPNPNLDLAPADLRAVAEEIRREFPLVATHPALVLFDVDPTQVQAMWRVGDAALTTGLRAFPAGASRVRPLLRLRRIEADGSSRELAALPQPVRATGLDGVARFTLAEGGGELEAELGLASGEGGWLLLARSNRIRLPARPSPEADQATLGPGRDLAARTAPPEAIGGPAVAAPSVALPSGPAPVIPSSRESEAPVGDQTAPPVGPAITVPVVSTEPSSGVGPPADNGGADREVEPALAPSGPPLAPAFPLCWSDPEAASRYLRLIAHAAAETLSPPTAEAEMEEPPGGPALSADPGSWPELPPPLLPSAGGLEASSGGWRAQDPLTPLSSFVLHDLALSPELEIHAELYLWGHAAPDSLVALFGRTLRVGPDGRFSLRLALRDPELLTQPLAKGETNEPSA